jgi:hypothetical protein
VVGERATAGTGSPLAMLVEVFGRLRDACPHVYEATRLGGPLEANEHS